MITSRKIIYHDISHVKWFFVFLFVFSMTQPEGLITGTMVKMFTIAGPVIVSGAAASAVYGLVLVLLGAMG